MILMITTHYTKNTLEKSGNYKHVPINTSQSSSPLAAGNCLLEPTSSSAKNYNF